MTLPFTDPVTWAPETGARILAVIAPANTSTLEQETYFQYLAQRVVWLIERWMDNQQMDQEETHQLLEQYLQQLYPLPPPVPVKATAAANLWLAAWSRLLVTENAVLLSHLNTIGVSFPVMVEPNPQRRQWVLGMFKATDPQPNLEEWLQETAATTLM